ncbi:unnamed protein product [Eruca vesicaria subsp. sativa]|uniref:NYN domain-containing protein n=1 Tax=Eruca vesicaria subsp. sativa TaxID=29727 RepID=A0ABC8IY69_ERUVS|nr:unnamed protein product [Eruca vesicaria subsp. sativa]
MPTPTSLSMSKMIFTMTMGHAMPPVSTTSYAEAKTGVFWDTEECPIPEDLDPETVCQNIRSALANSGYHGEVTIKAFGDRNQIPGYFESAGIEMFPKGDKYDRIGQMQLEFFGWMRDNECEYTNMMVVSRSAMEVADYLEYENTHHNILFAEPLHALRKACGCKHGAKSKDPSTETWVWETLAVGGDPIAKTDEKEDLVCKMEGNE